MARPLKKRQFFHYFLSSPNFYCRATNGRPYEIIYFDTLNRPKGGSWRVAVRTASQ